MRDRHASSGGKVKPGSLRASITFPIGPQGTDSAGPVLLTETGLRREVNPELCDRMAAIYGFLYRELVEASVNKETAAVDDALKVLRLERETWALLLDKINSARAQEGVPSAELTPEEGSLCVEG